MKSYLLIGLLVLVGCVIADSIWVTLDPQFTDSTYSTTVITDTDDSTVIEVLIPGFFYKDTTIGGQTYKRIWLYGATYWLPDSGKQVVFLGKGLKKHSKSLKNIRQTFSGRDFTLFYTFLHLFTAFYTFCGFHAFSEIELIYCLLNVFRC